ncbi:SMI1/KNR4 family protein [Streptomyces sp. NPDC007988]|uniref:SMI1/KNR4 family protein n=1 Tax=Streptomyces sp. NPDC007988 TaxID=3364802 RepID=UPI0036E853D6
MAQVISRRVREYFSDSPFGECPPPVIHPPATQEELAVLEIRSGQTLEAGYREFLSLTDGLEFRYLFFLGCRDWESGEIKETAEMFRETVLECDPEGVGIPSGTPIFPIAVNHDGSWGVFLIDIAEIAEERYWWTGEGDNFFFTGFADVLTFLGDPGSFDPRETLL